MSGFFKNKKEPAKSSTGTNLFDSLPTEIGHQIFEYLAEYAVTSRHLEIPTASSTHAVVAFGSVNRRIRLWSEPYLFKYISITFGEDLEDMNDLRLHWKIAEMKMEAMLQTEKLRQLVKVFKFQWVLSSLRNKQASWPRFWSLVAHMLVHFSSLETVMLDLPTSMSTTSVYGLGLKNALVIINPPDEEQKLRPVPHTVSKRKRFVKRYISCIPQHGHQTTDLDDILDQLDADPKHAKFLTIKTAYLTYNSAWMLLHCPNLERLVMEESPDDIYDEEPDLKDLMAGLSRLTAISLPRAAHESTVRDLSKAFPDLEELSLYPPMITGVSFFGTAFFHCMLDEDQLQEVAPAFKEMTKLRHLELRDAPQATLFSEGDGDMVRERSPFVNLVGRKSATLEVIQLGEFVYRRKDGWVRQDIKDMTG